MENLTHGGDWAGYEEQYGGAPLDFSSNVSPLGLPKGVRQAVIRSLRDAERYPDPLCRQLRRAIASSEGVDPLWCLCRQLRRAIASSEGVDPLWCLCGSGSADLIYRAVLAKRPQRALVTAPAFAEYEAALALVSCRTERYTLRKEEGFLIREDFFKAITSGVDMVFLCEPNNPTGRTTSRELLLEILTRCRETGTLLVVDECFGSFLDNPDRHTLCGQLREFSNLLILKAFTKLYAMAGLRLGYCLCSDAALLDAIRAAGQPWAVSGPAQAAGIAALAETEYAQDVRALTARERPWLAGELVRLGCEVIPGEANYLLFTQNKPLLEPLRRRGILLRGCGNYQGLSDTWYRAAVRNREDNRRFIVALEAILKEETP